MRRIAFRKVLCVLAVAAVGGYAVYARFSIASLTHRQKQLEGRLDSLTRICTPSAPDTPSLPGVSRFEMNQLKKRGAEDLREQLFSSLQGRRDLIPHEGVLGGTMYFPSSDQFWLLVHPWAMVYFEDGHRAGYLLLEYRFDSPQNISWKLIHSQLK
ncbi:MAG: hypothetical protein ACLFQB_10960 [Chitinispirillaceae bacterium]